MSFPLYWANLFLSFLLLIPLICSMVVWPHVRDVQNYEDKIGNFYCFLVSGINPNEYKDEIWGDKIYTSDSPFRTAAVHSDWLAAGQTGNLKVEVLGLQVWYDSVSRNGILSYASDEWPLAYQFVDYCCGDGQYNEPLSSECKNCAEECALCSGDADNCQRCKDGYGLDGSTCKPCTAGTYSNPTGLCVACPLECSSCLSGTGNCAGCVKGYYLEGSKCLQCPSGTTSLGGTQTKCEQKCESPCGRCSEPSVCLECEKGYFQYIDETGTHCLPCVTGCDVCEDLVSCKTCKPEMVIFTKKCYSCGTGSYFDPMSHLDPPKPACARCPSGCVKCNNNVTCEACETRFKLNENFECVNRQPPWKGFTTEYILLIAVGGVAVGGLFILLMSLGLNQLFTWNKKKKMTKHTKLQEETPRSMSPNTEPKSPPAYKSE